MTSVLFPTQKTTYKNAVYLLYNISKEYNLEIATKKDESIWFRWKGAPKNKNYYK